MNGVHLWDGISESANQRIKSATGGARTCGKGAVCALDVLFSKCASILSMIALSSIAAMTLALAPQTRHLSTSMLKTRLSLCEQVMAT